MPYTWGIKSRARASKARLRAAGKGPGNKALHTANTRDKIIWGENSIMVLIFVGDGLVWGLVGFQLTRVCKKGRAYALLHNLEPKLSESVCLIGKAESERGLCARVTLATQGPLATVCNTAKLSICSSAAAAFMCTRDAHEEEQRRVN